MDDFFSLHPFFFNSIMCIFPLLLFVGRCKLVNMLALGYSGAILYDIYTYVLIVGGRCKTCPYGGKYGGNL